MQTEICLLIQPQAQAVNKCENTAKKENRLKDDQKKLAEKFANIIVAAS